MVDTAIKVNIKKEIFFPMLTVTCWGGKKIKSILFCLNADYGVQGLGSFFFFFF